MRKQFLLLLLIAFVFFIPKQMLSQVFPPTVFCPANQTLYAGENCQTTLTFSGASVVGAPASSLVYSLSLGNFSEGEQTTTQYTGTFTVTVSATNQAGTSQCTYTIKILDQTPPVVHCPASKITVYAEPGATTAEVEYNLRVYDDCPVYTTQKNLYRLQTSTGRDENAELSDLDGYISRIFKDEFPIGITTVNVSAVDLFAGTTDPQYNTGTCSFEVEVIAAPLTVVVNKAADQFDPATGSPVRFAVVFSEDVTGFDANDISLTGTTVPGTLDVTVSGSGKTYTVEVNGITGAGDVVVSIPAGVAVNSEGLLNLASTSTDNVVRVLVFQHDLLITKTALSPYVVDGGVITYTITVVRIPLPNSPTVPVQNVVVNDVLPLGATFTGFIPVSGNTATPFISLPTATTNSISLLFPLFQVGEIFQLKFQVRMDAGITGTISNTATVGGPLGDVDPSNNSATVDIEVIEPPTISCPENFTLYSSATTCVALYTFLPEQFEVTGGGTKISIDATNGDHFFGITDITSTVGSLPKSFQLGVYTVTATATNDAGKASCTYTITVVDDTPPKILECPTDITVNSEPGKCSAFIEFNFLVEENCSNTLFHSYNGAGGASSGSGPVYGLSVGRTYSVGEHTMNAVFTDDHGNSSSCSFKITVLDNEKPVITNCPAPVTVQCALQIPAVDISAVIATDNCGTTTITHVDDVISNQLCANKYTITRTYKATDEAGNEATCTQVITVDDNTAPTITGLTPSKQILAPPNHKMVDVYLDYTIQDNCVSAPNVTIQIESNEPVNGTGDGDTDPDWQVIGPKHIRLRAERSAQGTGRIYSITVTVDDGCNATVSATTEVRVTHNITGPHSGNSFKAGSTVTSTGEFWDVPGNTHTAKWLIDGSTTAKAAVTEPAGNKNGKVAGSYKFTTPGVYKLQMNVTDQKGVTTYANTNGDLESIVVIYDPNGGHTYGGGYFNSPAGALLSNPSSTGKASYGFAMNYFKNSTNPKGETQFEFKVGDFEFNALNFDYLVISNSMAQFKGTGKITGAQSGIGFTLTVVDGQLDGTGTDKIRMKIYNKNNGKVIYDNQPGASDAALPTQAVGANSIIVIDGADSHPVKSKVIITASENKIVSAIDVDELTATVYPNPASNYFNIAVNSNDVKERIVLQVFDQYGRLVEVINNAASGSTVRLGDKYRAGVYYVKVMQGKQHKELKLVKMN